MAGLNSSSGPERTSGSHSAVTLVCFIYVFLGFVLTKCIYIYNFLVGYCCHTPGTQWEKFSTKSITSRQHPYPELQSIAWNAPWKVLLGTIFSKNRFYAVYQLKKQLSSSSIRWTTSEARVCVAWMADFLQHLSEDYQFPDLPLMRQCVCLGQIWAHMW